MSIIFPSKNVILDSELWALNEWLINMTQSHNFHLLTTNGEKETDRGLDKLIELNKIKTRDIYYLLTAGAGWGLDYCLNMVLGDGWWLVYSG